MNHKITIIALVIMGYVIGSIPFAIIVSRLKGIDIRKVGSKNPGAANVFREVGKPYGIIVWAFDTAKGAFAMLIAHRIFHLHLFLVTLVGVAAVVGHCWSMFMRFKGGKGVATSGGVFLYLLPKAFPFLIIAYFLVQKKPRSIPVVVSGFAIPLGLIFLIYHRDWRWLLPALAIFLTVGVIANISAIQEMREKRKIAKNITEKGENNENMGEENL
ncbi:MAG: acyl-phosphate glycerol 3-phosphate acyltransferase [Candidatus Cloacimonas sp. 4484_209]|nr:MAG: acyl-phosphate glycerol 3-phosphate acyltransferase [Candidatus Cloacimonas sp. 4484_209]